MPRLLSAVALAALIPALASAQERGQPSWWALLDPDVLVQRVVQAGIFALRSQFDIKYVDMNVDLRSGRVTLTDVQMWPYFEWDRTGDCTIEIPRLTLRGSDILSPEAIAVKAQAWGAYLDLACLPPPAQQSLAAAGLEGLEAPQLTMSFDYDIPSAEADVLVHADLTDLAALSMTASFTYLALDGRADMEEPQPVAYLSHAALEVEDRGGWDLARGLVPPPFANPDQAELSVTGLLGQMLASANRDAAGAAEGGADPSALSPEQRAFVDSAAAAWAEFLRSPGKLVVETGFDPQNDQWLDFVAFEEDPRAVFATLQPRVGRASVAARSALPAALVRQAISQTEPQLSADERRTVGAALITGDGAPRDLDAGVALLLPLAEAGDLGAADILSGALEHRDPETAYRWALVAAADGRFGAGARLDRLEKELPFAQILALQAEAVGNVQHPLSALQRVSGLREQALQRLSGAGQVRSYPIAALWALLGAAAGDAATADILADLDEMAAGADEAGRAAWAAAETDAAALAMEAWLGQDLPARFGGE
ncbi:hypothetical protein DXV76_11300 [Rhodobacteraceae bacterium CCMM004]|nr:hypothetical protein DXV76_11300 [Rhodobacteraceae bacterium CCMM004]